MVPMMVLEGRQVLKNHALGKNYVLNKTDISSLTYVRILSTRHNKIMMVNGNVTHPNNSVQFGHRDLFRSFDRRCHLLLMFLSQKGQHLGDDCV